MNHITERHARFRLPLAAFLVSALTACSATGPKFVNEPSAEDKATVYIFRPSQFKHSLNSPEILIGKTVIGKLKNGGYLKVLLDKGNYLVQASRSIWTWDLHCTPVFLEARQGDNHYIALSSDSSARLVTVHPTPVVIPSDKECKLTVLPEEEALPLIQETQLSK